MASKLEGDGRIQLESLLHGESLQAREVMARTETLHEFSILPEVVMVGLGGKSIFDRGRAGLLPIVEQLAAARNEHQLIAGVGGGVRVRHTIALALDLGIPPGGIAQLVESMETVNALLLNVLLANEGFIIMNREHFWHLPLYLGTGLMPIVISSPPYRFWEPPPRHGRVPEHGFDFGLLMHADVLGMRKVIYVKDQDGLFDRDPALHDDARLIPETTLEQLLENLPEELILDRELFTAWQTSRHVETLQIINGLIPGELTRALAGESVGTVITRASGAGGGDDA